MILKHFRVLDFLLVLWEVSRQGQLVRIPDINGFGPGKDLRYKVFLGGGNHIFLQYKAILLFPGGQRSVPPR